VRGGVFLRLNARTKRNRALRDVPAEGVAEDCLGKLKPGEGFPLENHNQCVVPSRQEKTATACADNHNLPLLQK
jgi:hypothetical protein